MKKLEFRLRTTLPKGNLLRIKHNHRPELSHDTRYIKSKRVCYGNNSRKY